MRIKITLEFDSDDADEHGAPMELVSLLTGQFSAQDLYDIKDDVNLRADVVEVEDEVVKSNAELQHDEDFRHLTDSTLTEDAA